MNRILAVALFCVATAWGSGNCRAQSVLVRTYADAGLKSQSAGDHESAIKSFDLAIREAERANDTRQLALSLALKAQSLQALKKWADAEKGYARAIELSKKVFSNQHDPVILEIADNLAFVYAMQGKYADAERFFRWLLPIHEKANPPRPADVNRVVKNMAIMLENQQKFADAAAYYRRLAEESTRTKGRQAAPTLEILVDLGECQYKAGNTAEAETIAAELKGAIPATSALEVPEYVRLQRRFATVESGKGRRGESVRILTDLLPLVERASGKIIDARAEILSELGDHHLNLDRLEDAVRVYRERVDLLRKEYGPTEIKTLDALYSLGWSCYRANAYVEAAEFAEQARAGYVAKLGPTDVNVAHSERILGHIARGQEQWEQAAEHYRSAATVYQQAGKDSTGNAVSSLNDLSAILIRLDRPAEARRALEQALAVREAAHGEKSLEAAKGLSELAWFHRNAGDLITAERLYQESISRSEAAVGADSPELSPFLAALAGLYRTQGKNDQAEQLLTRNLRILESRGPTVELKAALSDLAFLLEVLTRYGEAETYARRAVGVAEAVHGPSRPETAAERKQLAWILMRLDRWDEGRRLALGAIEVLERAESAWESSLAGAYNTVAGCLYELGDLYGAERYYKKGLAIEERLDADGAHFLVYNLGLLYASLGKEELAEANYRDSIQRQERHIAKNPPRGEAQRLHSAAARARVIGALAHLSMNTNRLDQAEILMRERLSIIEGHFDGNHVDLAGTIQSLCNLMALTDRYPERIPLAERQLQIVERSLPENHSKRATALGYLAIVRNQQGRINEAGRLYRRAAEIAEQVYGRDDPQLISYYEDTFDSAAEAGRLADARAIAGRVRDLRARMLSDDLKHETALGVEAEAASLAGDYRAALKARRDMLALAVARVGSGPATLASRNLSVVNAALNLGDLDTARAALAEARRLHATISPTRLSQAFLEQCAARFDYATGDSAAALEKYRKAIELRRATPEVYPASLIDAELAISWKLAEAGQVIECEEFLRAAQSRIQGGIDVSPRLQISFDLADAYLQLLKEQPRQALALADSAHQRSLDLYGPEAPAVAESAWLLGRIHLALEAGEEATRFARQSLEIRDRVHLDDDWRVVQALKLLGECQQLTGDTAATATGERLASAQKRREARIAALR